MSPQELERSFRAHLGRNDALEILLDSHVVDGGDRAVSIGQEPQSALEGLVLLSFPVEVDSDGYAAQGEGGLAFRHQSNLWPTAQFMSILPG